MPTDLATTTDHDALPEPVQALAPHLRRAWEVRAAGGRWRDAAKAAGVEVGTLWRQAQHHIPFRDALRLAYLEHDDAHRDVIARTLADGTAPEATDKDKDRALRAAVARPAPARRRRTDPRGRGGVGSWGWGSAR